MGLEGGCRSQAATKRHRSNIGPTVLAGAAYKGELLDQDAAGIAIGLPALLSDAQNRLSLRGVVESEDGEVWHVRERFIELQNAGVEPVVQFPHAIRAMDHAQKDSRRAGNEAFHIAQADLEGLDVGTTVGNQL